MDSETRFTQGDIQAAHRDRASADHGANEEPLYGLEPHAGGRGEAPVEQSQAEEAAGEGGVSGGDGFNLTWGIILGGVLTLFLVTAILVLFIGNTYQADIVTHYPIK